MLWSVFSLFLLLISPAGTAPDSTCGSSTDVTTSEGGSGIPPTFTASEGGSGIPPTFTTCEGGSGIPPTRI